MTRNAKKISLASLVVICYLGYSLHQRNDTTPLPVPKQSSGTSGVPSSSAGTVNSSVKYRDGNYTGPVTDALYGNVQIKATISDGKLTAATFLQYPNDQPNSRNINGIAMPILQQEALSAQSANVDVVSGATDTSQAFTESLTAALNQAQ